MRGVEVRGGDCARAMEAMRAGGVTFAASKELAPAK